MFPTMKRTPVLFARVSFNDRSDGRALNDPRGPGGTVVRGSGEGQADRMCAYEEKKSASTWQRTMRA